MSFAYFQNKVVNVQISDPAGDEILHVFRAPEYMTLVKAYASVTTAMGTSKGAKVRLLNYGTAGTAVGGTVTNELGGSAAGNDFATAAVPVEFTISNGALDSGEWLVLNIDEEGDWQGGLMSLQMEFRPGKSA